uniref:SRP54-type proteins GTP-binding domain-containing protein n=1 Tax=Biomphalaria glabrata TaxID=6526 RepID=A0A2C9LC60_BIOGL
MFDLISSSFNHLLNKAFGNKKVSEKNILEVIPEIRKSLIDADVALDVVEHIVSRIAYDCLGDNVLKSLNAKDIIIKSVYDILVDVLGGVNYDPLKSDLHLNKAPSVIMLVGLQGSGKTTSVAKLGYYLNKKKNKKILVASLDVYRPAAKDQLEKMSIKAGVHSLEIIDGESPEDTAKRAMKKALSYDVLILDTAGRLHVDQNLLDELKLIKKITSPSEILFVSDSMIGQEAIVVAKIFNENIGITGVIVTRADGDSRGGSIISMKYVTNCPIRFVGVGEKIEDFEYFYPDRYANRILGMGDIISAVEKAKEKIEEEEASEMIGRIQKGIFDFNDMLKYYGMINKFGGIGSIMQYMPMMGDIKNKLGNVDGSVIKNILLL